MQTGPPWTRKQTRNLNRRFELGVYRKKTIADYPLLHAFLANLLGGAHDPLGPRARPRAGERRLVRDLRDRDDPHRMAGVDRGGSHAR